MQVAIEINLDIHQLDVKTAYLNAPIDSEVYVRQPEGFEGGKEKVWKLKKSLYGLKQSGRNWNIMLSQFFIPPSHHKMLVNHKMLVFVFHALNN